MTKSDIHKRTVRQDGEVRSSRHAHNVKNGGLNPSPAPNLTNEGGRPTKYEAKFAQQAHQLCLLGSTDQQLAVFFKVSESTLNLWKLKHPKFSESIREGKEQADASIAKSLFHRAKGYEHPETHFSCWQGQVIETETTKHYPPDTTACMFWLKNRQPATWRDVNRTEHTGQDGKPIQFERILTDDELMQIAAKP